MSPATAVVLLSILVPVKGWFAPNQPLEIDVQAERPVTLVLTDFTGKPYDPEGDSRVEGKQRVDLKRIFRQAGQPGTSVLSAVPRGLDPTRFVGTPLVIDVRGDTRPQAPPGAMVTRVQPLQYAVISTDQGEMTVAFYYDLAPATVENFIRLASEGFYDGLPFFRIVPGMLVQTGDPRGDGTGGPGYHIEAEFNNRQHVEGVLSMARQMDPIEKQGAMPRSEAANSAGSQFFICLNYENTRQLDRRYTAFGQAVGGLDVLRAIGATPVKGETPQKPVVVNRIQILPVTPQNNPYRELMTFNKPLDLLPTTAPAAVE